MRYKPGSDCVLGFHLVGVSAYSFECAHALVVLPLEQYRLGIETSTAHMVCCHWLVLLDNLAHPDTQTTLVKMA